MDFVKDHFHSNFFTQYPFHKIRMLEEGISKISASLKLYNLQKKISHIWDKY